jgi:hypothetical protein
LLKLADFAQTTRGGPLQRLNRSQEKP